MRENKDSKEKKQKRKAKFETTLHETDRSNVIFKLVLFSVFSLVLALYFTGWGASFLANNYKSYYKPSVIIESIKAVGFPFQIFALLFVILECLSLFAVYEWYRSTVDSDVMGRRFKSVHKADTYGNAHFAKPKEYEDYALVQDVDAAYGTILGQIDTTGKKLVNYNMNPNNRVNRNMMVIGASGTGKTFTFTLPYIFQTVKRRESLIITDPDMGLYAATSEYLMREGYEVRWLCLSDINRSDTWNPLLDLIGVDSNDIATMCTIMANAIIDNAGGDASSIYTSGPKMLLKAMIMYVMLDPTRPDEKKTLAEVYDLVSASDGLDGLERQIMAAGIEQEETKRAYRAFKSSSENLSGNILMNLTTALEKLQENDVRRVLSGNDIQIAHLGERPCAYFCSFPDTHSSFRFLTSLFFTEALIKLCFIADHNGKDRCLNIPVNFLLDEAAAIGKIPDFARMLSVIRKRKISVVTIFQDITQFQNTYKLEANTIMNNSGTFIVIGTNEMETATMVEKRIGEATVEVTSEQRKGMDSPFRIKNKSAGQGKRSLITAAEINRMGQDDVIVIPQQHYPIWLKKYPNILHPDFNKLVKIETDDVPAAKRLRNGMYDTSEREEYNKRREETSANFYKENPHANDVDRKYTWIVEGHPNEPFWSKRNEEEKRKLKKDKAKKVFTSVMGIGAFVKGLFTRTERPKLSYDTLRWRLNEFCPQYEPLPLTSVPLDEYDEKEYANALKEYNRHVPKEKQNEDYERLQTALDNRREAKRRKAEQKRIEEQEKMKSVAEEQERRAKEKLNKARGIEEDNIGIPQNTMDEGEDFDLPFGDDNNDFLPFGDEENPASTGVVLPEPEEKPEEQPEVNVPVPETTDKGTPETDNEKGKRERKPLFGGRRDRKKEKKDYGKSEDNGVNSRNDLFQRSLTNVLPESSRTLPPQ